MQACGQTTGSDSPALGYSALIPHLDTPYHRKEEGWIVNNGAAVWDTIRCIMLCGDSSYQKFPGANVLRKGDGYTINLRNIDTHRIPRVFQMIGYRVSCTNCGGIYTEYLNSKKKPLGAQIIVWQYIDIDKPRKPF